MRLKVRRTHLWSESYLHYRYLWPNLENAVERALGDLPLSSRTVLDIGCGNRPYADLFAGCRYIGLNYDAKDATPDVVGDAMTLPIATASMDLVFCSQVIEHVPRPWLLIKECRRVLRRGGWLILSAPFYWPLHEEPADYFRFTRYGLQSLVTEAGFSQCDIRCDGGDSARFWLSALHTLPGILRLAARIPFNVAGLLSSRLSHRTTLPANYTLTAKMDE